MNWNRRDIVFILIIVCLAIGWGLAVVNQQTTVARVTNSYNHLVNECNKIIEVKNETDFCITLPNESELCHQNDLNMLAQSLG
jgi:hypothetical protein